VCGTRGTHDKPFADRSAMDGTHRIVFDWLCLHVGLRPTSDQVSELCFADDEKCAPSPDYRLRVHAVLDAMIAAERDNNACRQATAKCAPLLLASGSPSASILCARALLSRTARLSELSAAVKHCGVVPALFCHVARDVVRRYPDSAIESVWSISYEIATSIEKPLFVRGYYSRKEIEHERACSAIGGAVIGIVCFVGTAWLLRRMAR